jgi:hypothetical protein
MANQIKIAYSATAQNVTPGELSAAMGAVPLYSSPTQDPVLGQFFGLTIFSDAMSTVGDVVTRTIILNMDPAAGAPPAPPAFILNVATKDGQAAVYSTVDDDALVNPTTGAPGAGAQTVSITYLDAEGNAGTSVVNLNGRIPVIIPIQAGTNGIVEVTAFTITATGATGNSIGQLTISVYTPPPPGTNFPPANTPELRDFLQDLLGIPKADRIGLEQKKYIEFAGPSGQVGPVSAGRAGFALAYIPPSYYSPSIAPTPAAQIATLTNFFTQTLALALATFVTPAVPVLI